MDKVLITGIAGMIGSHLADILLEKGHHVLGLDDLSVGSDGNLLEHEKLKFINGSALDSVLIESLVSKVDAVVHLATFKKRQ